MLWNSITIKINCLVFEYIHIYICWTQRKIFWRMWETEQLWGTIDLGHYWPKTAWLQTFFRISSFVFSRTKTFIQVWNYWVVVSKWWQNCHFWVNYPFNHTSLYLNIIWIGLSMIMKEYSAVVMKLMHIWLTDKLHALISVLAAQAPCSAMAARVPGSAVGPGTGATLEAFCPVSVSLEAPRVPTPSPLDVAPRGTPLGRAD